MERPPQGDTTGRWQLVKAIWAENQWLYIVTGFLLGVLVGPFLTNLSPELGDFLANLVPEAVGIVFTVLVIDRLSERRANQALRARLIRELSSTDNGIASQAAKELAHLGWLQDGSVRGANLWNAELQQAVLFEADLRGADLTYANLKNAFLENSDFRGANLREANLESVLLASRWGGPPQFDETTILPDGSHWTPATDIRRFTDPAHSDFWRSAKPYSPAHDE